MKVNFLANLPLSEKDKQKKATELAIKCSEENYYGLPLAERQRLREQAYHTLFVMKAADILPPPASPASPTINLPVLAQTKDSTKFQEVREESLSGEHIPASVSIEPAKKQTFALSIELNERQRFAADLTAQGKSFVLTGAAGTGKTTTAREIAKRLLASGNYGFHSFRIKGGEGQRVSAPSIAFVAYTNRAASNLARSVLKDPELSILEPCITTIHNLLEYEPEFFDIVQPDGEIKQSMRFVPRRHALNKLSITHLVIEESSQVGATDLYPKLLEALRPGTQIIFMGDINQLQPIFSASILNYALITLPVVELTEVYRQALDSPIISNAHHVLKGENIVEAPPYFRYISGKTIRKLPSEDMCSTLLINSLKNWLDEQQNDEQMRYDPEQDMILSPFNKHACGTIEINYKVAQILGQRREAIVYEVIASMRKLYLAVGDKVMFMKQDGVIISITHNAAYIGRAPQGASKDLNRFGQKFVSLKPEHTEGEAEDFELHGYENLDIDKIADPEDDKKKQQASHLITIRLDNGLETTLSTAGEFGEANFSLGYALTVHKAQGCEWRKVFILLHRNHAVLLNRELLYTAITRAREYCYIIDLCNVAPKAISNQKIKGNSTKEKIAWFNSEISLKEPVSLIP